MFSIVKTGWGRLEIGSVRRWRERRKVDGWDRPGSKTGWGRLETGSARGRRAQRKVDGVTDGWNRPGPKLAGVDWRLEVLVVGGSREKLMGKIAWGCGHFRVKPLSPEALVD